MKAHPIDILTQIETLSGTGSKKAKEKIIADNLDCPEFVQTVEYAMNPWKNFFTTTIPGLSDIASQHKAQKGKDIFDASKKLPWKAQFTTMFKLLDDMSSRKLPPNSTQTRAAALDWAKQVGPGTIEVFRRILQKDLKCKVGTTTFNKIKKDWIPEFKLSLAKPFDATKLVFPCFVDPKYDGERCLAQIAADGSVTYLSRYGNMFFNYGCFSDELVRLFKPIGPVVVDCEVIHKLGFQHGQRTPSYYDPNFDTSNHQLVVFDFVPQDNFDQQSYDVKQSQRYAELSKLFKNFKSNKILMIQTQLVQNQSEMEDLYAQWVAKGLEGIICKQPDGDYHFSTPSKRNPAWMKVKPKETEDLVIVDIAYGDKDAKWAGKCGALVVERKAENGKIVRVNVGSGLTDYDRENIKVVGDQILYTDETGQVMNIKGKVVEVTFDCATLDGSLRFPRVKHRGATIIRKT